MIPYYSQVKNLALTIDKILTECPWLKDRQKIEIVLITITTEIIKKYLLWTLHIFNISDCYVFILLSILVGV